MGWVRGEKEIFMKIEIEQLRAIKFANQLAFAYLICERLYPNYVYFSKNFSFGNVDVLRESINCTKDIIIAGGINKDKILQAINDVNINTPDTEDYQTIFVSSALDASCSIIETLEFSLDREFERLSTISTFATDSVYMFVQSRDNLDFASSNFERDILNDPLMLREISIQKKVISFLISNESLKMSDIDFLMKLQGKSGNLNLY